MNTTEEISEHLSGLLKNTANHNPEVEHPDYYNNGIEAIDYIESHNFNFNLGNIIKYVTRCNYKGDKVEDLEKAMFYLKRELEKEEK